MILGFASAWLELPGVIAATFAIGLGASGGSLVGWQYDRGLWMLAGLFLSIPRFAVYSFMVKPPTWFVALLGPTSP
jgi:hypothetical protein